MKKTLLTGLFLLGIFAGTQAENWIINPSKSGQQSFTGTNVFVLQSDQTTVGVPAAGDNVYLKAGDNLRLNSSSGVTAVNIFAESATVEVSSGCTIESLSLTNSTITSSGTASSTSRTLVINALDLTGDNTFDVGLGAASSFLFNFGRSNSGAPNALKITGSGTVTKTGAGQLCLVPNTDLTNNTTFSGNWILAAGDVITRTGSSTDKRCDFLPGTAVEIQSGASYTIQRMYGTNGFTDGDLSGQTITVKSGGTLNLEPLLNNSIVMTQSVVVESMGTFNIKETNTASGSTYPKVTLTGDLVLASGANYNVGYGSKSEDELLTLNTTTIKAVIATGGIIIPPIINYGSNPMPVYDGSITIDATFYPGVTAVDFSPLFDFGVPSSYQNDILVVAAGAPGNYTVTLPTIALSEDGKTWILYDGEDQKVDMSQTGNSYTFALPAAANTISFRWAESILSSIKNSNVDKGSVIATKYYNLKGLEVKEPVQNSGLYIQQNTYENGSVVTSKVIR